MSSLNFQELSYVSKIELMLRGDSRPTRQVKEEATERHPQRPVLDAKRVHDSNTPQEPTRKASTLERSRAALPTKPRLEEPLQAADASVE